jgi:hypothetical protein
MSHYRVRTIFTGAQGSPWLSTLNFGAAGGTAAQAVTAVAAFWGAVDVQMPGTIDWTTEADVGTYSPAGELEDVDTTTPSTGAGGAGAGELLPRATQGLIRLRTGLIIDGRELRGRIFIPGLSESVNDNGTYAAASRATINTAAAALISDANSTLLVWSKRWATEAPALTGVTATEFAVLTSRRD